MPSFNSSASRSIQPMLDPWRIVENYEIVLKYLQRCNRSVDAIIMEDVAKYPKVSVKIMSDMELMKHLNMHRAQIKELEDLRLESHIDQLAFLLRSVKPNSLSTSLPIDTTIDVIREMAGNGKWLNEIKEKIFTITSLNDSAYWRELRIDRVYGLINGLLKTTKNVSELSIETNFVRISSGTGDRVKSTTYDFDVEGTLTKKRLDGFLRFASCISGVRVIIGVPLVWLDCSVSSQCLENLGVNCRLNPAHPPARYALFRYLSLGPIAIALE